jgi:hypothetical protein
LKLVLNPIEEDDDGKAYPLVLRQLWLSRLCQLSPQVAEACASLGTDFGYKMRYQGNALKVSYTPRANIDAGLKRPLVEIPVPKDKWIYEDITVLSYPPMPDQHATHSAQILVGGGKLQERYDDPGVQGGQIALIASNNNKVQRPPNSLDRIHASVPKQVAYNQHILSAEDEIAGINSEVGDFLSNMSVSPAEPIIICTNAGESLKRHEQHLGGQLWLQSDRQMTATNIRFDRMSNDATSVTLAAAAEAVEWAHVLETGLPKRTTQRVVIYPPSLSKLETVLTTWNVALDMDDGPCMRTHQSSSPLTRGTLVDSTLLTRSRYGCVQPPKFQPGDGSKLSKMAETCATLRGTLKTTTTAKNSQGCTQRTFSSIQMVVRLMVGIGSRKVKPMP